jgi:helix-turn-helix protein
MATGVEVLSMLIPSGGWAISGDKYEDIKFIEAEPITKSEFEAGFKKVDAWKLEQEIGKANAKAALLERLGITEDEAKLLLS